MNGGASLTERAPHVVALLDAPHAVAVIDGPTGDFQAYCLSGCEEVGASPFVAEAQRIASEHSSAVRLSLTRDGLRSLAAFMPDSYTTVDVAIPRSVISGSPECADCLSTVLHSHGA